jgi:protein-tyrosine phosphatase
VAVTQRDRQWALDGCCNFRDLGGYPTTTAAKILPRRLFRSDSLASASAADRARFAELGLTTVIDLRSETEIVLGGRYDGRATYHHLPLGNPLTTLVNVEWNDPQRVAAHYVELLHSAPDSVAEALAVLTDPAAYPAVIHCSIGKDRTGIVTALLLALLDIADDDIVADYALSGIGAARLALRLRDHFGDRYSELEPLLPALLSADPATMRLFLAAVRTEYGSVEGYVDHIGVSTAIPYLRDVLLEHRIAA